MHVTLFSRFYTSVKLQYFFSQSIFRHLFLLWGYSNNGHLKLIFEASEPQSNGITRSYSKATAFGSPMTPVATAIDIKSSYEAKCGAPTQGNPKVFFKYFYINTATGKKSGEVLVQCKLD